MVDSSYRWLFVAGLVIAFAAVLLPVAYSRRFPIKLPIAGIGIGIVLTFVGIGHALLFNESLLDALLLRAPFGFPGSAPYGLGYGRWIASGYAFAAASALVLAIGTISKGRSGSGDINT